MNNVQSTLNAMNNVKSTLKKITIDNIREDIQRLEGIDHNRVMKMADRFTPTALSTITVSQRDNGDVVVLDGRHRCAAAKLAGYKGLIPAVVHTGLSREQEAELFIRMNENRSVSSLSKFVRGVDARFPDEVEINDIVESHGWKIGIANSDGTLAAVQALYRIYRDAVGVPMADDAPHPKLLDHTMHTITEAWAWDRKSADSPVLVGVGLLYARFGTQIDDAKLITVMRNITPGVLVGKAKALRDTQGGTVPSSLAKVLVGLHNNKRRTNLLPEWIWTR